MRKEDLYIENREMLTLRTLTKKLKALSGVASSSFCHDLWWSIQKIENFCLTARLDASPVGVVGRPGSPVNEPLETQDTVSPLP